MKKISNLILNSIMFIATTVITIIYGVSEKSTIYKMSNGYFDDINVLMMLGGKDGGTGGAQVMMIYMNHILFIGLILLCVYFLAKAIIELIDLILTKRKSK